MPNPIAGSAARLIADTRGSRRGWAALIAAMLTIGLCACNGTGVVTLTATASADVFLAYRVGLVSVQLQTSSGKTSSTVLPSGTTVDLAGLVNLSEVVGAPQLAKASYTQVVVTLDYSAAQILYDDGTPDGLALSPVGANGQALGQVALTLLLDPSAHFSVTAKNTSRLALDFNLAASNVVDTAAKTVTVTPVMMASAAPIDTKTVRIRGPLSSVDTGNTTFTASIVPFDFPTAGSGSVVVAPTDSTTYEINGSASTGTAGLAQLAGLTPGTMSVTFGTLTASTTTTTTTTNGTSATSSSSDVSFSATQVLAGSSIQSANFDRVSGIVTARSGDTLAVEDGTLLTAGGSNELLPGTATITVGPNTVVTVFGQGTAQTNTTAQISIGSLIDAFGAATTPTSGNTTLDASAGEVRLGATSASGLVTQQGTDSLTLNLIYLGGRAIKAFDFSGTPADSGAYVMDTGSADLANAIVGAPVEGTGLVASFGAGPPDFSVSASSSALLDPTTIPAELIVDYGAGTAAPFVTYTSTQIDVDAHNANIGTRHTIQVGALSYDIQSLSSDPLISPTTTASNTVFAISHSASGSVENFNSYGSYITQLQAELTGSILVTNVTATGQYTATGSAFSATSMTVTLNN